MAQTKQQTKAKAKKSTVLNDLDTVFATEPQVLRARSILDKADADAVLTTFASIDARANKADMEVLNLADRKQHKADVNLRYAGHLLAGTTRKINRSAYKTLTLALRMANKIGDPEKREEAYQAAYAKAAESSK